MAEYARDTYSKTGAHLLGSIAIVHPFTISVLLERAKTAVGAVGEVRGCDIVGGARELRLCYEGVWQGGRGKGAWHDGWSLTPPPFFFVAERDPAV